MRQKVHFCKQKQVHDCCGSACDLTSAYPIHASICHLHIQVGRGQVHGNSFLNMAGIPSTTGILVLYHNSQKSSLDEMSSDFYVQVWVR